MKYGLFFRLKDNKQVDTMVFLTPSGIVAYLKSPSFKKFIPDWIIAVTLGVYFFVVAEHAKPFARQFSLDDLTISHPFATVERVTGINCILISTLVPLFVILGVSLAKAGSSNNRHSSLHNLQIAILGLAVSLCINGVVTDILKNWISRPRPDFLARCGPEAGTPTTGLVDINVCTAPLGIPVFIDGMRSTPSGHSSISFSGLLYLTLWLFGQFKVLKPGAPQPLHHFLLFSLPILLASYIALSRTQDYRHHFVDIILGGIIGIFFAVFSYHRYFHGLWTEDSEKPLDEEATESLLPR
ncbi:vacuolar diacylglycerol pyrophosphate phosphatase [Scheffersomyces xylosifermentans]|uniref:vacuolar diacylglycerol pyrophosphate phosphatase n=1 Tax=Scheffersomyces xylosifermentans TaxID=1304137 RepID=UPI00315CA432